VPRRTGREVEAFRGSYPDDTAGAFPECGILLSMYQTSTLPAGDPDRLRVGIFQIVPAPESATDASAITRALVEIDAAERLGFDAVWLAEHHLSGFGLVGAPSVLAAAVSQRTRRIDIGYAVAVLPLHHPVRIAEEIA